MAVEADVRLADGEHVVQFYDTDDDLVGVVVGYLSGAILDGDTVVMIATPEHRAAFEGALREAAVDLELARAEGRLLMLDAADTLAQLLVEGAPDAAAFDEVVGGLVRAASAGGGRVRAFGEMVALLWDEGAVTAAIELEELWNALGERTPFSLFCAYPAGAVSEDHVADELSAVCHLHTRVVARPAEVTPREVVRRFSTAVDSPRHARQLVSETLLTWDLPHLVDDAAVIVSELATNSVRHAASAFTLRLSRRPNGVRIEVQDADPRLPERAVQDPTRIGGRGLIIVDALAADWSHRIVDGGKIVWVDLAADPA